eukprot:CAMPEP_0182864620 /NCGR_PEP_ID=MMETSP0034_2-20130328/7262_1 /TAXON_ID=156128 /ORGANISM="Nephroselmis pyriformis, Strain CCMP717" /LENGTH=137 /DNA_ID=CAMNT_0024996879 /DNA_START=75 /DNA_END=488 /DNA_ORIENTATION=+
MANASSGVAVDDACVAEYLKLKTKRTYKYIVYKLSDDLKTIVVEKLGEPGGSYEDMVACLPEHDVRYAVFDHEYQTNDGHRSKIILITWAPDTAKIKQKMLVASSRTNFVQMMQGIQVEVQATDLDELDLAEIAKKF